MKATGRVALTPLLKIRHPPPMARTFVAHAALTASAVGRFVLRCGSATWKHGILVAQGVGAAAGGVAVIVIHAVSNRG
jgi:hypothetical protein